MRRAAAWGRGAPQAERLERGEGPPRVKKMRRAAAWGEGAPQAERRERGEGPPRLIKKVLVTGARGQLARAIIDAYQDSAQVLAYSRGALDIADFDNVMSRVQADSPDVIINCAAYTNVERAEDEADAALTANAFAVRVLARAAQDIGATLVHYSTDFVFDGKAGRPYVEEDVPNPQSVYAQSKLLGEWFALDAPRAFVLRVESLFGGANA
jgi:dTDP-4-dehydrorhamnose reductase